MICPHCYSPNITLVQFDFGQDKQTGVHDKGEIFECRGCQKVSTVAEVEAEDERSFEQTMTAGCVLARAADLIELAFAMRMHQQAGLELRESLVVCQQEARLEGRLDWVN